MFESAGKVVRATTICDSSAASWELLRLYLQRYDCEDTNFRYHATAVGRILSLRPSTPGAQPFAVPNWLVRSYRRLHAPGLLAVYLQHDLLEDALALAADMIDGVLGLRGDEFGTRATLKATSGPLTVWLPYSLFDQLDMLAQKRGESLRELRLHFQHRLDTYIRAVEHTADNIERVGAAAAAARA